MEKTQAEFILFLHHAMNERESADYTELYQFLTACYVRADSNMDGRVYLEQFDALIEEAAELPRLFNYAPKSEVLYPTTALRKAARARMFHNMDHDQNGYITLEEWIRFAMTHIEGKLEHLPKDYLSGSAEDVSKEEFITFMKQAVKKDSPEYKQLYFFLLKCFQQGDVHKSGAVDHVAFDKMIEAAAAAPRRFGLAPETSQLYKNEEERISRRKADFVTMDKDKNGFISFTEWLDYAFHHIMGKVAALP